MSLIPLGGGPVGSDGRNITDLLISASSTPSFNIFKGAAKFFTSGNVGSGAPASVDVTPDTIVTATNISNATTAALSANDSSYTAVPTPASASVLRVGFAAPPGNLTGMQTFSLTYRQSATGTGFPSFTWGVTETGQPLPTSGQVSLSTITPSQTSTGLTPWSNLGNLLNYDQVYATCTNFSVGVATSETLQIRGLGISLPTGAKVRGISVDMDALTSVGGGAISKVQLVKNGVQVGNNEATGNLLSTVESGYAFGSASDLWGTTWTKADVESASFGVDIEMQFVRNATISLDDVLVIIDYVLGDGWVPASSAIVNTTADTTVSVSFDASAFSDATGASVEVELDLPGGVTSWAEIGQIDWTVQYATPTGTPAATPSFSQNKPAGASTPKAITSVITPTFQIVKRAGKALILASSSTYNTLKAGGKTIVSTTTPTAPLFRATGKLFTNATTNAYSLVRKASKAITSVTTSAFSAVKTVTKLPFLGTSTPAYIIQRQVGKFFSLSEQPAYSAVHANAQARTLAGATQPTYTVAKATGHVASVLSNVAYSIQKTFGKLTNIVTTPAFAFARLVQISRNLTIASQPAFSTVKSTAKALILASTPTFTFARRVIQARLFTGTNQPAYSVAKATAHTASISSTNSYSVAKAVAHTASILSTSTYSVVKGISKAISFVSTPVPAFNRVAAQARLIFASTQPTYSTSHYIGKVISFASTPVMLFNRVAAQARLIFASSQPAFTTSHYIGKAASLLSTPVPMFNRVAVQARVFLASSQPTYTTLHYIGKVITKSVDALTVLGRSVTHTVAFAASVVGTLIRTATQARVMLATVQPAAALARITNRTVTFASSVITDLARIASQNRTIAFAATVSSTLLRSSSSTVSELANTVATMVRIPVQTRIFSTLADTQSSLSRTAGRLLLSVIAVPSYLTRSTNKAIAFASSQISSMIRATSQARAFSAVTQPSADLVRYTIKSFLQTTVPVATFVRTAIQSRISDAVAQIDSHLARAFSRTVDYAVGLVSQATKTSARVANAAGTGLAYLLAGQALNKTINMATSAFATASRTTLHFVAAATQPPTSLVRAIGATRTAQAYLATSVDLTKRLSAIINQSVDAAVDFARTAGRNLVIDVQAFTEATSDADKAFIRLADALVALDAALSKQLTRNLSAAPIALASLFRSSSISSDFEVTAQPDVHTGVGRTLSHDVAVEPSASNMKVLLSYINSQVQAIASVARQALSRRTFSSDVTSIPSAGKGATHTVQSNADLIASSNSGQSHGVDVATSVDASLTTRFGKAITSAVSGLAGMIGAFIIGPRQTHKQRGGRGIGTSTNEERVRRKRRMGISVQLGEAAAYKEYEFEDSEHDLDIRINIKNVFTAAKNVAVAVKNIFIRQKPDVAPVVRIRNDRDQA